MPWRWPWVRDNAAGVMLDNVRGALEFTRDSHRDGGIGPDREGFLPIEYGGETAGVYQTENVIPAAYAAINLITDQLAMLPRRVVNRQGQEVSNTTTALLRFPSRIVDPIQFWEIVFRSYITHGNSYAYIRRSFVEKDPIELVPAICSKIRFVQSRMGPRPEYTLNLLGTGSTFGGAYGFHEQVIARPRDVIAFHGAGFNGLRSPSPISFVARDTIRVMKEVNNHHHNIFKEGINSGIALTIRRDSSENYKLDTYKEIKDILSDAYKQSREKGGIPFLPPGVELTRVQALSAQDLELVQFLRWGVEDIARVWNVSPIRLGHYHEGMRARTFEDQAEDFERYTIVPHAKKTDSQLTTKLLSSDDVVSGLRIESDTNELARGSMSERIRASEMATARGGFMTINEARQTVGLQPMPDGDRLLQPKGAPEQTGRREQEGGSDES